MGQNWYGGSDMKFLIKIEGGGFSMDEYNWGVSG